MVEAQPSGRSCLVEKPCVHGFKKLVQQVVVTVMTAPQLAIALVEASETGMIPKKIGVFIDRLMLRLHAVQPMMSYCTGVNCTAAEGEKETVTVEVEFHRLPEEVLPQVLRLIAAPNKVETYRYVKHGSARMAFKFKISEEDLKGDAFDYAG